MVKDWTPEERADYLARFIREERNSRERDIFQYFEYVGMKQPQFYGRRLKGSKLKKNLFNYISEWAFKEFSEA